MTLDDLERQNKGFYGFFGDTALAEHPLVSTSKTLYIFIRRSSGAFWQVILFYLAFFETVAESHMDEIYG